LWEVRLESLSSADQDATLIIYWIWKAGLLLIDRRPLFGDLRIERQRFVARIAVTEEIPRRSFG
jgi:hypothetical protein